MNSPSKIAGMVDTERQFLRIAEGLVHLRHLPADAGAADGVTPLWLLHASPSSSRMLEPLMHALHAVDGRRVLVAPDTLGNGDSVPPAPAVPDIAYFADSVARMLDAAGVRRIDVYGTHTGARIACELAVRHPARVRRVVLDGIGVYENALKSQILEHYAPTVAADDYGRQFIWAFNFVRDQWLHFPYFLRDPEHRLMRAMPSAQTLHLAALDVLKAIDSYHKPYLAAFRYDATLRLPLVEAPTLFLRSQGELPSLNAAVDALLPDMQDARVRSTAGDADKAGAIADFLGTGA